MRAGSQEIKIASFDYAKMSKPKQQQTNINS